MWLPFTRQAKERMPRHHNDVELMKSVEEPVYIHGLVAALFECSVHGILSRSLEVKESI